MSVVAAYLYRDGRRVEEVHLDRPMPHMVGHGEFVWIGLLEPTEDELRSLQQNFALHPLAVEDAMQPHEMPKLDIYGDQLFITMRTAYLQDDRIMYGETSIFVGPNHIISVRHGSTRAHIQLRAQLEASPQLLAHGVDYVLHAILDFGVDGYFPIAAAIEDQVLAMERRALDEFLNREEVTRLFTLRHQLIKFQRVLGPTSEMVRKLVNLDLPCIDHEVRPYFNDVLDHVRRMENMVAGLRDVLTSVFEIGTLLEQQRQGVITRQLAAWAAILAVPTAIAGVYGMNFKNMPELEWQYGYHTVLSAILILCATLYWRFKRANWL